MICGQSNGSNDTFFACCSSGNGNSVERLRRRLMLVASGFSQSRTDLQSNNFMVYFPIFDLCAFIY